MPKNRERSAAKAKSKPYDRMPSSAPNGVSSAAGSSKSVTANGTSVTNGTNVTNITDDTNGTNSTKISSTSTANGTALPAPPVPQIDPSAAKSNRRRKKRKSSRAADAEANAEGTPLSAAPENGAESENEDMTRSRTASPDLAGPSKKIKTDKTDPKAKTKELPSQIQTDAKRKNKEPRTQILRETTTITTEKTQTTTKTDTPESSGTKETKETKTRTETASDIINRHKNGAAASTSSAVQEALKSEKAQHSETRRQLREVQSQLRVAEDKAAKAEKELQRRVEELEKELKARESEIVVQNAEIATQTKLITDHTKHHDSIKDGLSCGVCFEIFEDPHLLSCGHTACRKCLIQWFRSSNAYRGADIDAVIDGMDLTYRTKICHMCREPVLRRPVRMFALQSVIETLGLAPRRPDEERNEDHWALTFPEDPTSYLIKDASDAVNRCPACGCEVVRGFCEGCDAQFSDDEADGSVHDLDETDEEDDNDAIDDAHRFRGGFDLYDYDREGGGVNFARVFQDALDRNDALFRAQNGMPPALPRPRFDEDVAPPPGFIDDIADVSDDGFDSLDDHHYEPAPGHHEDEFWDDGEDLSDDDGDFWGDGPGHHAHHRRHHHQHYALSDDSFDSGDDGLVPDPADILRYGREAFPDSDSDTDNDEPHFLGARPRRANRMSPPPRDRDMPPRGAGAAHRRGRARIQEEEEEDEEEDAYEDSFIDDESVHVLDDSEAEVDAAAGSMNGSDEEPEPEVDEPTVDELRQRRAARFGGQPSPPPPPPPAPGSPPRRGVARRARRIITVSDSE